MMHKESPPEKNSFLEDLDKLDVSIYGGNKTGKQLSGNILHIFIGIKTSPSLLPVGLL